MPRSRTSPFAARAAGALAVLSAGLVVPFVAAPVDAARAQTVAADLTLAATQTFFTYVGAGEVFSSVFTEAGVVPAGSGDPVIAVTRPRGAATTCAAITATAPAGTTCTFTETATEAGVYAVSLSTTTGSPTAAIAVRGAISASAEGVEIPGRTWTDALHVHRVAPGSAAGSTLSLWYQTPHGYTYRVDRHGLAGDDLTFRADAFGVVDATTCTSAYQSLGAPPHEHPQLGLAAAPETCAVTPAKVFLAPPAADLPASVLLPTTNELTWLRAPVATPTISLAGFTPDPPGSRAGAVTFTVLDFEGNVRIEVDADADGVFTGPADRSAVVGAVAGLPVRWSFDGFDGAGQRIPAARPLAFRVVADRVGEIHLVDEDVEVLAGGLAVTRLNGPPGNEARVFWNDEPLAAAGFDAQAGTKCSGTPLPATGPEGVDSTGGVHTWGRGTCPDDVVDAAPTDATGGTWGDNRALDTWAYADGDVSTTITVPGAPAAGVTPAELIAGSRLLAVRALRQMHAALHALVA